MEVEQAKKLFLIEKEVNGLSPKSISDYTASINRFLKETNITTTEAINKQIINSWIYSLQEQGIKAVSINKYIRDIRVFCYWLMNEEFIKEFKIKSVKTQEPPLKYYTDDEVKLLLKKPQTLDFYEYRTWTMIQFMLATGARIGTVLNIKVEDIDFKLGTVIYRYEKNKHTDIIPLTKTILLVLKFYTKLFNIKNYLFGDIDGNILTQSGSYQALEKYCNERGVERHSWHSFRHTFARSWIINGGDAFTLSTILCHHNVVITKKYVRLFGSDIKNIDKFAMLENISG